jgi:U3 small nucleolar RNA-associated protein 7
MVGLGRGRVVEVWQDLVSKATEKQRAPYMTHEVSGEVAKVEFCPFEDCLGIGHASGFSSMIVPGGWSHRVSHMMR